jgi:hypothetical protein
MPTGRSTRTGFEWQDAGPSERISRASMQKRDLRKKVPFLRDKLRSKESCWPMLVAICLLSTTRRIRRVGTISSRLTVDIHLTNPVLFTFFRLFLRPLLEHFLPILFSSVSFLLRQPLLTACAEFPFLGLHSIERGLRGRLCGAILYFDLPGLCIRIARRVGIADFPIGVGTPIDGLCANQRKTKQQCQPQEFSEFHVAAFEFGGAFIVEFSGQFQAGIVVAPALPAPGVKLFLFLSVGVDFCSQFLKNLLRLVIVHLAGASVFMATAAVLQHQFADVGF